MKERILSESGEKTLSGVSQYLIIAETIKGWITSGRFKPGQAIATVGDLAEQFGVARGTIQEAMKELSRQGFIVTSRGKRSRVKRAPQLRPVIARMDLGDVMFLDQIGENRERLLSIKAVTPDEELRESFDFGSSEHLIEYRSIAFLNDRPNAFVICYIPDQTGNVDDSTSSAEYRAEFKRLINVDHNNERRISALTADLEIARHLEIPVGTAVLRSRCIVWHKKRQLDLYYESFLRSDDCEYRMDA